MKHRILFCASVAAFALLAAQPGLTQVVPPPYPGTLYPGGGALPPHEIVTIVRSTGLDPIGRRDIRELILRYGTPAEKRDGVAITGESTVTVKAEEDAELVLVDAR